MRLSEVNDVLFMAVGSMIVVLNSTINNLDPISTQLIIWSSLTLVSVRFIFLIGFQLKLNNQERFSQVSLILSIISIIVLIIGTAMQTISNNDSVLLNLNYHILQIILTVFCVINLFLLIKMK